MIKYFHTFSFHTTVVFFMRVLIGMAFAYWLDNTPVQHKPGYRNTRHPAINN